MLTITGSGFNASAPFVCRFSFNNGQAFADSLPVTPRSASEVQCVTPLWKYAAEGMHACVYACVHITSTKACIVCMYVYIYVYICICAHAHTQLTCTYTHTQTYVHTHTQA